jgi:hypothetical protein
MVNDLENMIMICSTKKIILSATQKIKDVLKPLLAEMFDLYKTEQLQTAVNEEIFNYDLLSNKEKAICLSAFMEMYASERRSNIDLNRDKFSDLSFLLSDYIGEERADTIQTEINNKHKTEELILDQWIY